MSDGGVSAGTMEQRDSELHHRAPGTDPVQIRELATRKRLGSRLRNWIRALFGGPMTRRRGRWSLEVYRINALEDRMRSLSTVEILQYSRELRRRAGEGVPLNRLLPEAFALVREAARRTIEMRPYDVQLLGGIAIHNGCIVEMETGEGKTLVAVAPAYLNALTGRGVHIVTVNDYLAQRDAEWMGPVYRALGLTVGCIVSGMDDRDRHRAYRCDVTYVTAKELGFDYLRDRLRLSRRMGADWLSVFSGQSEGVVTVQREHHFAIVDEADSILIDEARTPLIIATPPKKASEELAARYRWADRVARLLEEKLHYTYDPVLRKVELTLEGCRVVRQHLNDPAVAKLGMEAIYEFVERAVLAHRAYLRDRDYVVVDDKVVIVDEYTGRMMEGREWQRGIHRAVEAKEGIPITQETGEAARITIQTFFRKYEKLAGMTGTAVTQAFEFRGIYKTPVFRVPTNMPVIREVLPPRIFATAEEKWRAVADEVERIHAQGRPILIGTRSIEKSELLSALLKERGIPHQVLNAKHHAREAEIVARAGEHGAVTVATNMAGRGTDIKLAPGVAELGGLFVIGTEFHTARRIDRQLIGRCGRQGDPGTAQFFISLEDEILDLITKGERVEDRMQAEFMRRRLEKLRRWARSVPNHRLQRRWLLRVFERAQRRIERLYYNQRRQLMEIEKRWDEIKEQVGLDPVLDWREL